MKELFELWVAAVLVVGVLVLWRVDRDRRRLIREAGERRERAQLEVDLRMGEALERIARGTRISTRKMPLLPSPPPTRHVNDSLRPARRPAQTSDQPAWSAPVQMPSFDYAPPPAHASSHHSFSGNGGSFDGGGASGDWSSSGGSSCDSSSSSSDSSSSSCSSD